MAKVKTVKWLATGGLVLGVALMGGTAWATELIAPASTSTARNGGAASVTGSTISMSGRAHPWVAQIYAPAGRCLRLEVTSTTPPPGLDPMTDLGMQVSAPNAVSLPGAPAAWRDDDTGGFTGGCSRCPLIKAAVGKTGWYTVTINFWDGKAFNSDFVLKYAHYAVGSANCAPATGPNQAPSAEEQSLKPQTSPEASPQQQFEELDMK